MKTGSLCCCVLVLLVSSSFTTTQATFIDDILNGIQGLFAHYEEAPFTLVGTNPDYEDREYPARKWVCTREVGNDINLGPLFWRLFEYISGNNEGNISIPMTVPVATEVKFQEDNSKEYTMCFFIGEPHQSNPPNPANTAVFLQDRPATRVLTRRVGGYMRSESAWMEEAGSLAVLLQEHGVSVPLSHVY
ncbi:hypothetical protein Pcinc_019950, partial [Petrolisthes cinctipes]